MRVHYPQSIGCKIIFGDCDRGRAGNVSCGFIHQPLHVAAQIPHLISARRAILFSIKAATPKPFEVISSNVSAIELLAETIGSFSRTMHQLARAHHLCNPACHRDGRFESFRCESCAAASRQPRGHRPRPMLKWLRWLGPGQFGQASGASGSVSLKVAALLSVLPPFEEIAAIGIENRRVMRDHIFQLGGFAGIGNQQA